MNRVVKLFLVMVCSIGFCLSCENDSHFSEDINNPTLLPNRGDYLNEDYKTQALAQEVAKAFKFKEKDTCLIDLMVYDDETRTQPLLSFTDNEWPVIFEALESGALNFGFKNFQTEMMPLKMNTNITVLLGLNSSQDTIYFRGTNGEVRTQVTENQPIGMPLPESDDAELEGYYVRATQKLYMLFDLMLPVAVKAHIHSNN